MRLYPLNKTVIRFYQNPHDFLNGLASNVLTAPRNAFLNLHGRIIATFDQLIIDEEEVWIIVEKPFVKNVLEHLERYLKLSGVKAQELTKRVYFDLDGDYKIADDERAVSQKHGQMIMTDRELKTNVGEDEFKLFRLRNHIPLHGVDYQDEMLLNVSEDEFVSYTKGCFLGQEFVAKVHNRSKPTWRLVVRSEAECNPEEQSKMTSKTFDSKTKKNIGFVFVKNG